MSKPKQGREPRFDFPYEYQGGGYWRRAEVPKGQKAETLHGDEVVSALKAAVRGYFTNHPQYVWWSKGDIAKELAELLPEEPQP